MKNEQLIKEKTDFLNLYIGNKKWEFNSGGKLVIKSIKKKWRKGYLFENNSEDEAKTWVRVQLRDIELEKESKKEMKKEEKENFVNLIKQLIPEFKIKKTLVRDLYHIYLQVEPRNSKKSNLDLIFPRWYNIYIDLRCTSEIWLMVGHMNDLEYRKFYNLNNKKELKSLRKDIIKDFKD